MMVITIHNIIGIESQMTHIFANLSDTLSYIGAALIIGTQLVYLLWKTYKDRHLGLLLYSFLRDINRLLKYKLQHEWSDYDLSKKLELFTALRDFIEEVEKLQIKPPPKGKSLIDELDDID
jgi:hypothetical protein